MLCPKDPFLGQQSSNPDTNDPHKRDSFWLTSSVRPPLQCFLLAAMKFHCHCAALPARGAAGDARCAMAAIEAGVAFVKNAANVSAGRKGRKPLRGGGREDSSAGAAAGVSACHVRWLCLSAFRTVLRRKQVSGSCTLWDEMPQNPCVPAACSIRDNDMARNVIPVLLNLILGRFLGSSCTEM